MKINLRSEARAAQRQRWHCVFIFWPRVIEDKIVFLHTVERIEGCVWSYGTWPYWECRLKGGQ